MAAYTLNGTGIKAPNSMQEDNNTQYAQQRTLSGSVNRDYFGSNKRVWKLEYKNISKANYDIINTAYQAYLSSGTAQTWVISETNYSVSTTVHINLDSRGFSVGGSDYISSFNLILSEA
jgi:hypothetical protein